MVSTLAGFAENPGKAVDRLSIAVAAIAVPDSMSARLSIMKERSVIRPI